MFSHGDFSQLSFCIQTLITMEIRTCSFIQTPNGNNFNVMENIFPILNQVLLLMCQQFIRSNSNWEMPIYLDRQMPKQRPKVCKDSFECDGEETAQIPTCVTAFMFN